MIRNYSMIASKYKGQVIDKRQRNNAFCGGAQRSRKIKKTKKYSLAPNLARDKQMRHQRSECPPISLRLVYEHSQFDFAFVFFGALLRGLFFLQVSLRWWVWVVLMRLCIFFHFVWTVFRFFVVLGQQTVLSCFVIKWLPEILEVVRAGEWRWERRNCAQQQPTSNKPGRAKSAHTEKENGLMFLFLGVALVCVIRSCWLCLSAKHISRLLLVSCWVPLPCFEEAK